MNWLERAALYQNQKQDFVIVTLLEVRGHAPRTAGSKMLVTASESYGSIGGGNLEETALKKARALLAQSQQQLESFTLKLNLTSGDFGIQCCGGEVKVLLERIGSHRPSIAIFGAGHVGQALLKTLGLLPVDIYMIDSRKDLLANLANPSLAKLTTQHAPIPETALEHLPTSSLLIILTHDHAEDLAILDTALKNGSYPFIGLIGSEVKWTHFRQELQKHGHSVKTLERVRCPIGLHMLKEKHPAAIAISTAAQILAFFQEQGIELKP